MSYKPPFARKRTSGSITQASNQYLETAFNGTVLLNTQQSDTRQLVGDRRVTNDTVTPNYRALIQQGRVVNHGYSSIRDVRAVSWVGHSVTRNSGTGSTPKTYVGTNQYYSSPPILWWEPRPDGVPMSALEAEAGTTAKAGINRVDVEGQVEIAEIRKIRDTFRIKSGGLNRYLTQLMRGRKSLLGLIGVTASELSRVIESNWLRYRYGIMPAVYLLEDLAVGERVRLFRESSKGRSSWSSANSVQTSVNGFFYNQVFEESWNYTVEVSATVIYNAALNFDRFGLSPRNIFNTAWELVPYSFVADWFVNIGQFIRATSASVGVKQLASCTVVREKFDREVAVISATWNNISNHTNNRSPSGGYTATRETTTRFPGTRSGIVLRRESIHNIPHDQRLVDTWALTMQNFRRLMTSVRR